MPAPTKLSVDSASISPDVFRDATTMTVFIIPGVRCRQMMRTSEDPATFAAAT